MGHYQVRPLSQSLVELKWDYGALTSLQEEDFIRKRLAALYSSSDVRFPRHEQSELAQLIGISQALTRKFAQERFNELRRCSVAEATSAGRVQAAISDKEVKDRASSVVSLRDIQRVFTLFNFFNDLLDLRHGQQHARAQTSEAPLLGLIFTDEDEPAVETRRRAMLLAIGVTYYVRLPSKQRVRFQQELHKGDTQAWPSLSSVLNDCMDVLIADTELEPGIASTRGLKENVFMVVMCLFAGIKLTIIGPPGSSKTLSVTVAAENAKGDQSKAKSFYRTQKRLVSFPFQCSRRSTSIEVATVFKRAIEKQKSTWRAASRTPPHRLLHMLTAHPNQPYLSLEAVVPQVRRHALFCIYGRGRAAGREAREPEGAALLS